MAGHSQFKNIMHKKGKQDAIRSKLFSKLAREITVAAKMGLPDPNMNARLRAAVLAAKAENMPKDNIERAIKKASGADAENYDEVRYEGYAPGGVAVIIEGLTDNRNRTAGEVRSYFTKAGGALAETGAVSFMFDRVGLIEFDKKVASEDAMMEAGIEAGADDGVTTEETHEIRQGSGFAHILRAIRIVDGPVVVAVDRRVLEEYAVQRVRLPGHRQGIVIRDVAQAGLGVALPKPTQHGVDDP